MNFKTKQFLFNKNCLILCESSISFKTFEFIFINKILNFRKNEKMKKLTGIIGVAIFAMVMFFNTAAMNTSSENLNLANLNSINNANAMDLGDKYIDLDPCFINGEEGVTRECHPQKVEACTPIIICFVVGSNN